VNENAIAREIVDAAFRIHTILGPGLLESVYETVLAYELTRRELRFVRQQLIPIVYENVRIEAGFRADLIVEDKVTVEIKSVEALAPVHRKQLLTCLKLADKRLGLLINLHEVLGLYRERSGEESYGNAGVVSAGAFSIQRLEGSRFGTVVLWVLNGGAGGEGWGAAE
jgi:GxxExxY protein